MFEDPIVKEVRTARQKHAARFKYDLKKIYEDLKKKEKQLDRPVISLPPKKPARNKSGV